MTQLRYTAIQFAILALLFYICARIDYVKKIR